MLITQLKSKETIASLAEGKVFIINCHGCKEVHFPEKEALELQKELEADGKLTGAITTDYICNPDNMKLRLEKHKDEIAAADVILVLSCGVGVQTVAEYFEDKKDIFLYIVDTHKNEAFDFVENFIKDCNGDIFAFMRMAMDCIISAGFSEKMNGMKRMFSQPWVFDMIVSDRMKGKLEEAKTPKGIMFKYIDKNSLNVESDDEILSLINIFASISLGLFFKIFIMGKNGIECDSEKVRETVYGEIDTLEKKYKKH